MKRYTAQKMRELADMIDHYGGTFVLTDHYINEDNVAMLRQAADDMEREKRYEYSMRYYLFSAKGKRIRCTGKSTFSSSKLESAKEACAEHNGRHWTIGKNQEKAVVVRREIGEWEEVEDD